MKHQNFKAANSLKTKPDSFTAVGKIVSNVIKKTAIFIAIAFLPIFFILIVIVAIIGAVVAAITQHAHNETINNLINQQHNYSELVSNLKSSDSGDSAPGWLLGSILDAVFAILYIVFIYPLLWILKEFQNVVYFMSGGDLANKLLFSNTKFGVPPLFIAVVILAAFLLVIFIAIRAVEIMIVEEKANKLKSTLKNFILLIIAIPAIPIVFYTLNMIVNLVTQAIITASGIDYHDIGLFIFNSCFDNGIHNYSYVPANWTFDDHAHFNYLLCLFSEGFMIYIFLLIGLFLFWRIAELLILYVISPLIIISSVNDEGRRFMLWKDMALGRFISFNMIFLTYSLFLCSMSAFAEISTMIPQAGTRPIFILLGIFAFGIVVVKSPQLLNSIMGGNAALSDGIGNIMGLKIATNAFISGSVLTMKGVKGGVLLSGKVGKASQHTIGAFRGFHLAQKEHGLGNITKESFKKATQITFAKNYAETRNKVKENLSNWFTNKK